MARRSLYRVVASGRRALERQPRTAEPANAWFPGRAYSFLEASGDSHRNFSSGTDSKATAQSIYIHHADVGAQVNSAGLVIGLMQSLLALKPGTGFFRPIDMTTHGGNRAELLRSAFNLKTDVRDMYGCTQEEAQRTLEKGSMDDLLELILPAFERCKAQHDFLVISGTSLRDGSLTLPINATLCNAFASPALVVCDALHALHNRPGFQTAQFSGAMAWEKDTVATILDHAKALRAESVDVAGALVYHAPRAAWDPAKLHELMRDSGIPLLGAIPEDPQLDTLQLEDVVQKLRLEKIYGAVDESAVGDLHGVDINKVLVATLHLEDFIQHIPTAASAAEGALVVAHASRPDVLLGCIAINETSLPTQVAGVVLTGGTQPPLDIDIIIRSRPEGVKLPVLLSPMDTADTVLALASLQPEIHPTSTRKIERAEMLFQENVDIQVLNTVLLKEREITLNPKMFQHGIFAKAKAAQQHIVLPEGSEPRTIQAAGELTRKGLCQLTLLGDPDKISAGAQQHHVDLSACNIVDAAQSPKLEEYANLIYELRKHKGMSLETAKQLLVDDVTWFGTAMIAAGDADGMVSGAIHTTADTVRPALQIIKTNPETPLVSSVFFMCLPDKVLVYGDCALNTDPNSEELASIAISSADTARAFGVEPRVALLSYATGDSNKGPLIQKVADATAIAKQKRPDLKIEGPLQYDAAVNPETAKTKMKGKESEVAGKATVLIFPDLNTGNNTYKAVQQSTGAVAMGPVLQGLRKPVNDLSRGCTVKDIVTTVCMTALQAYAQKGHLNK